MASIEYIVRWRNQDGSWSFDENTVYTKREAEKCRQQARILLGIQTQLWKKKEFLAIKELKEKLHAQ